MSAQRVYIGGPIAGKPHARESFAAAEDDLRAQGFDPVNPFKVQPHQHDGACPDGPSAGEGGNHAAPCYMRTDLQAMLSCDRIYLLEGWELSSGARTEFEAARAAGLDISYESTGIDRDHLERQIAWSRATFGPGQRTKGVIDHIRKELKEIEADPTDLGEWVDVIILALDGAWRAGHDPRWIIQGIKAKQARNEARSWPDWRAMSEDQAIEHVRAEDGAA